MIKNKARLKLAIMDHFIDQTNEHINPLSQVVCEVVKVKARIKRRTETTNNPSRQI